MPASGARQRRNVPSSELRENKRTSLRSAGSFNRSQSGRAGTAFVRFSLGEGIEKKQEDLAAEVAKTIGN